MAKAYIGLGSNLGNKRRNLIVASALLAERAGDLLAISSFYQTEPWGFSSEHTFLNAALLLKTEWTPIELLDLTQAIEHEMGRTEKSNGSYHDRLIDLDILLYDDQVIDTPRLQVPHPLMTKRSFVLKPLAEIAPMIMHPLQKKRIIDLLNELSYE